jgi:hypothetical protein
MLWLLQCLDGESSIGESCTIFQNCKALFQTPCVVLVYPDGFQERNYGDGQEVSVSFVSCNQFHAAKPMILRSQ